MKPIQNSRCIVKSQISKSNPKRCWNLIMAVFLALNLSVDCAHAEFWFEDFTDGKLSDSGIDWTLTPLSLSSSDGLELNSPNGAGAGAARADLPIRRQNWSIRTQARLLRDLGVLGAGVGETGVGDTFNGIGVNSGVVLGKAGQLLTDWIETDLHPAEEDVIIQFDTFDDVLRMWAWRGEEPPEPDFEPLVEVEVQQPAGVPFLWTNSLIHPTATAQFSWIAISTEHMPVNIPAPLSDLIGDFSGNDELDVADINLLATAVREGNIHPQYDLDQNGTLDLDDHTYWVADLKHTWMGDADLDGSVNFADFLVLSGNFGQEGGWAHGDFDNSGDVQFADFLLLSSNFGQTAGEVATVPEPHLPTPLMALTIAFSRLRAKRRYSFQQSWIQDAEGRGSELRAWKLGSRVG